MTRDGWDTSFRDATPSDGDLSDEDFQAYLNGTNDLSRNNLDISNRIDFAQVSITPFTIAAQNSAASKNTSSTRAPKKKIPIATKQAEEKKEDTPEVEADQEASSSARRRKRKKRQGLLDLGEYSSYRELEEAAYKKAKLPGPPIEPAVPQSKIDKNDKKKNQNQWPARKTGWLDCRGNQAPGVSRPSKLKPKSTLDEVNDFPKANSDKGKSRVIKPLPPPIPQKSIIQRLDEQDAEIRKADAAAAAAAKTKKKPAKKEPVKAKGKGKSSKNKVDDDKITFHRLPAGASKNGDMPIVAALNRQNELQNNKRQIKSESPIDDLKSIPIDNLIPLTKAKKDLKTLDKKPKFTGQPSTKSAEFIEDSSQEDRESVDPPSEVDEPIPKLKSLLSSFAFRGNASKSPSKSVKQEPTTDRYREEDMPSLAHTNPTEPTDHILTPHQAETYPGNPSTMTHLSAVDPHMSDRVSSSSQVPYSSPAFDKARRLDQHVYAPRPVRDKSREISSLQHMASRNTGPFTNAYTAAAHGPPKAGIYDRQPDERSDSGEREDEWSTLPTKQPSRYAQKSGRDQETVYGPGSTMRAVPFPQSRPPIQSQAPVQSQAPKYGRITIFNPTPLGDAYKRDDAEYRLAGIPDGASGRNHPKANQYQVEPMQWTGSQRDYNERQRQSVPQKQRWEEVAERERPRVYEEEEDWRGAWTQKKKQTLEKNPLSRYAMSQDRRPKYDMEGRGQAF